MAKPNNITEDELEMVRLVAMLPIIADVLEYDMKKIGEASLKTPTVYIALMKLLQGNLLQDIKVAKRELRMRGVKILTEGKAPNGYKVNYLCRGYEHELVIGSNILKSLVIKRLCEMLSIPLAALRE